MQQPTTVCKVCILVPQNFATSKCKDFKSSFKTIVGHHHSDLYTVPTLYPLYILVLLLWFGWILCQTSFQLLLEGLCLLDIVTILLLQLCGSSTRLLLLFVNLSQLSVKHLGGRIHWVEHTCACPLQQSTSCNVLKMPALGREKSFAKASVGGLWGLVKDARSLWTTCESLTHMDCMLYAIDAKCLVYTYLYVNYWWNHQPHSLCRGVPHLVSTGGEFTDNTLQYTPRNNTAVHTLHTHTPTQPST